MGAFLLLSFAGRLRGKAALRGGCFVCRAEGVFLPARRQRALRFAEPRLSWAGVCPPAASGHFALRNRACLELASARLPPDEIGAAAACGASHAGHAASPGPG